MFALIDYDSDVLTFYYVPNFSEQKYADLGLVKDIDGERPKINLSDVINVDKPEPLANIYFKDKKVVYNRKSLGRSNKYMEELLNSENKSKNIPKNLNFVINCEEL